MSACMCIDTASPVRACPIHGVATEPLQPEPPKPKPCDCWRRVRAHLPHQYKCASLADGVRVPRDEWIIFARLAMEMVRHPDTQVTLERGRRLGNKFDNREDDNNLLTFRILLRDGAEDRVWPARYAGDQREVGEAMITAMAEVADRGAPPPNPPELSDRARAELADAVRRCSGDLVGDWQRHLEILIEYARLAVGDGAETFDLGDPPPPRPAYVVQQLPDWTRADPWEFRGEDEDD